MGKKEPTVSWQVLLDDAHWDQKAAAPTPPDESVRPRRRWRIPRRWLILGALFLAAVLVTVGLLLWQRAQRGLALMEEEIAAAVRLESTAQIQRSPRLAAALLDPAADGEWRGRMVDDLLADRSVPPAAAVEQVELVEGVALVRLSIIDPDQPLPSRVIRFYRDAPSGWLRTAPVASFWGAAEEWQGSHFIFRYRQRDREAVLLAAPQVEIVYQQLRGKLGLPLLPTYKTVVVQPDDRPLSFDFPSGELRQPSPHLLNLPDTISHENALFRSLIFYQINELVRESFDRYGYGRAWMWSNLTESALRNWLQMESGVVEVDLRLLFPWLLGQEVQGGQGFPDGVAEECQLMETLGVRVLLLACGSDIQNAQPGDLSALGLSRLVTTYDFDFSQDANAGNSPSGSLWRTESRQEIIAATTLYLYAVETYGIARFPPLLEALGDYRGWYEALPAAYGIPPEAFEVGWRVWLSRRFGTGE